jgi:hypothetical protein
LYSEGKTNQNGRKVVTVNSKEFMEQMNGKQQSLSAINRFIRQGCEFEAPTANGPGTTLRRLNTIGAGCASSKAINDGNGWNDDSHTDGGGCYVENRDWHSTETSTSPFHAYDFNGIKDEFDRIMPIYLEASGGVRHNYGASTHVHTAVAYADFGGEDGSVVAIKLPVMKMYRNVAMFLVRFLPVLKWVSMTNIRGARRTAGNGYDMMHGDRLYSWYNAVEYNIRTAVGTEENGHTKKTDGYMVSMQRESCFRIPCGNGFWNRYDGRDMEYEWDTRFTDAFHFENRMMDCNFSASMMSAWFALNRAIALFAYDMARNSFYFMPSKAEIEASQNQAQNHSVNWKRVDKTYIVENYTLMKSYLFKYFKLSGSLDALDVLDKLIDCPIPQFLEENKIEQNYDMTKMESHFSTRIRVRDDELRGRYIEAIKRFAVPMAGNLNDFHLNIAAFLGVQQKQAVSLYQMFKRENVDLEFMAGRLVYMGD